MPSVIAPAALAETALDFERLHAALSTGLAVTIVTPNRRLAVHLRDRYDHAQRAAGRAAWASADILPLNTFFERAFRALALKAGNTNRPDLLRPHQALVLWEQAIRRHDAGESLLSVGQTARQAESAWRLAHAWRLLPAMHKFPLHDDGKTFLAWAQRYQQLTTDKGFTDAARLPDLLIDGLDEARALGGILPGELLVAGFDILPPQQRAFFDALAAHGTVVRAVREPAAASAIAHRVAFDSEDAELRACAAWTRRMLVENPAARIAVVVPDLSAKRAAMARALSEALTPEDAGSPRAPLFNFSLGVPLADYGLVHDALSMIEFSLGRPLPFAQASALLRSPFIAGAATEGAQRARLDAAWREYASAEISLAGLHRQRRTPVASRLGNAFAACPHFTAVLERVVALGSILADARGGARITPLDWSRHFSRVLLAWGFPGEQTLDSTDFQVLSKLRDALGELAALQAVQTRMRGEEALAQLRRLCADTVFQPETPDEADVPVQVLGVLESAGQSFDALWVTGLAEEAWPIPARPNPFIPAALQRAAGVTEASAEASLALDRRITAGWLSGAASVILSHARSVDGAGEQERAASALIRDVPLVDAEAFAREALPFDPRARLQAAGMREPVPDTPLDPLATPMHLRGGVAVLRDQAACSFRAFARHRLGATPLEAPQPGLDPAARGVLLHRVLSLVWGKIETRAALQALAADTQAAIVSDATRAAIAEAHAHGIEALAGRFAEIEQARLARLVGEWLEYEKLRAPFEVVAREQLREVHLGGLGMRVQLDRLDRLEDGTYALIDYKTGQARIADWLGDRPDEPQLPLYFATAEHPVSALAFARVKRGERGKTFGFEGVSAAEELLPDVMPIEKRRGMEQQGYVSWDVLVQEWEHTLAALAEGFVGGTPSVDPKHGDLTCAYCELQGICRVAEFTGHALDAAKEGDDE